MQKAAILVASSGIPDSTGHEVLDNKAVSNSDVSVCCSAAVQPYKSLKYISEIRIFGKIFSIIPDKITNIRAEFFKQIFTIQEELK